MNTYSSDEACQIAGVRYHNLDYWIRSGFVVPSIEAAGSGTARRFTEADVMAICTIALLTGGPAGRITNTYWRPIFDLVTSTEFPSEYLVVEGALSKFCSHDDLIRRLGLANTPLLVLSWAAVEERYWRGMSRLKTTANV
jgi:hypothetical protein